MQREDFTSRASGRIVEIGIHIGFVPDLPPIDLRLSAEATTLNDEAMLALGELRTVVPALPRPALLTAPFLRREAVLSSKIEGTHTQVDQLYLFEVEDADDGPPESDSEEKQDAREVQNYLTAINYGFAQLEHRQLTCALIKEMHQILMTGVRGADKKPGEYRTDQAFVGSQLIDNARYVAPPEREINLLMDQFEQLLRDCATIGLPRLVSIALIHYQFEAIHPFTDGNGRIGRLLNSLLLAQLRILPQPLLYLSAYFERERSNYNSHLWEVSRDGQWMEWILFFLEGVRSEALDAGHRAHELLSLREAWREKLQGRGCSGKVLELADNLCASPAVSVNLAKDMLGMSYQGASRIVDELVELDILSEATGRTRNRIFLAHEVIAVLQ